MMSHGLCSLLQKNAPVEACLLGMYNLVSEFSVALLLIGQG